MNKVFPVFDGFCQVVFDNLERSCAFSGFFKLASLTLVISSVCLLPTAESYENMIVSLTLWTE